MPQLDLVDNPQADLRNNQARFLEDLEKKVSSMEKQRGNVVVPTHQTISKEIPLFISDVVIRNGWLVPFAYNYNLAPPVPIYELFSEAGFIALSRDQLGYAKDTISELTVDICVTLNDNIYRSFWRERFDAYTNLGSTPIQIQAFSVPVYLQFVEDVTSVGLYDFLMQIPIGTLSYVPDFPGTAGVDGQWTFNTPPLEEFGTKLDILNDALQGVDRSISTFSVGTSIGFNTEPDKLTEFQLQDWIDGRMKNVGLRVVADVRGISNTTPNNQHYFLFKSYVNELGSMIRFNVLLEITYKGVQIDKEPNRLI